jgi:exopolysaccharide biosynthesis polyprenyl glycosylphosphotransferase
MTHHPRSGALRVAYVLTDWLAAAASWSVLFAYRKHWLEPELFGHPPVEAFGGRYRLGLMLVPLFWVGLHAMLGMYQRPLKRHRLLEVGNTLTAAFIGGTVLFFALILDDAIARYQQYYASFAVLVASQWSFTLVGRMVWTTRTVKRIHRGQWGFPALVIGGDARAVRMVEEIQQARKNLGYRFVGFLQVNGKDTDLGQIIPRLGDLSHLRATIADHQVEEVIVAIGSGDHAVLERLLNDLGGLPVAVRIIPDIYDILSGSVRMSSIYGTPLIEVDRIIMPQWQLVLKRAMDWSVSLIALLVLAPLYVLIALAVKLNSKGPVFYVQERIGLYGKPFHIIKFRTMVQDAERLGPQLSSDEDPRITPVGRFLRKSRLDELPQFFNVIRGDMALVGPRPERAHFIEQIMERAPHYRHLQKVRPGITSWGQVKYGYATSVDEMIQRLRFDLIYIENMSIALDLKILAYTVITVLKGRGK